MSTLDTLAEGWREDARNALIDASVLKGESAADAGRYLSGELTEWEAAKIAAAAWIDAATADAHAIDYATANEIVRLLDATDWIAVGAELLGLS